MLQFLKQILSDCELSMTYHLYSIRSICMKVYYGLPSQRKTLLLFFGFFFLYIFFLTRFLQNAWTDFHDIFRDGVYWSRKTEKYFLCDDVTSGPRYWRFSNFQGAFCSEIFSETTQNIFFKFLQMIDKWLKFVPLESQVSSSIKRRCAVGLENRVWKRVRLFRCF